jgi:hypothetical protein
VPSLGKKESGQAMLESAIITAVVVIVILLALKGLYHSFVLWDQFTRGWDRIPVP